MRRLIRSRHHDEHGAIVVCMAVFAVVMVALAALVVDVGALLDEKRQIQNGADAAALGVAQLIGQTCSAGLPPCAPSDLTSRAQGLANGNARDNATRIDAVSADYTTKRVTVRASTLANNGQTILPYAFGQALTTRTSGGTVHGVAMASWAGLGRAAVTPLTVSKCEFDGSTTSNTVFDVPTVILFHTKANPCTGPSGSSIPGGFGWLVDENDGNAGDCQVTPSVGNNVRNDTGVVGTPHSCDLSTTLGKDILLAVYDGASGTGSNGTYHIYGFGQFHMTGYRFTGSNSGGIVPCSSPNTCIGGYFVRFTGIGDYGGPNLGNRVALLS